MQRHQTFKISLYLDSYKSYMYIHIYIYIIYIYIYYIYEHSV